MIQSRRAKNILQLSIIHRTFSCVMNIHDHRNSRRLFDFIIFNVRNKSTLASTGITVIAKYSLDMKDGP